MSIPYIKYILYDFYQCIIFRKSHLNISIHESQKNNICLFKDLYSKLYKSLVCLKSNNAATHIDLVTLECQLSLANLFDWILLISSHLVTMTNEGGLLVIDIMI